MPTQISKNVDELLTTLRENLTIKTRMQQNIISKVYQFSLALDMCLSI